MLLFLMSIDHLFIQLPFSIVIHNTVSAALFVLSMALFAIVVIWTISRKLRTNEHLKYEFITIIAHKFRTPLTHVKWSADELVKNETDMYKRQSLQDIQQSNEKLIKLTGTLIELTDTDSSATAAYALKRISINAFTHTIGETYKDTFHEKNIFFSVHTPPQELYVKVDEERMEFVLQTLFENALNYSSPGQNVEVTVERHGHKVVISVTDHGIGIAQKDLPLVFTKFFRAENARAVDTEGFGVGLYLARTVARRHKGMVTIQSPGIGNGATATLVLPLVK